MKKSLFILPVFCFLFFAFTSIEIATTGESPGIIQATANAGSDQTFTFQKWQFTNAEMPENIVENIKVGIEINTSSATCDWKDLEESVKKKKDYFYVKKFPKALIEIDGAEAIADGKYKTDALLTLKGITKPVALTFTISEEAPYVVKGEGLIKRKKFGFTGKGPKNEVAINFEVTLPIEG